MTSSTVRNLEICGHLQGRFTLHYTSALFIFPFVDLLLLLHRAALLNPQSWQYGVMLNRFTAVSDITQILKSQGFTNVLLETDASSLPCDEPLIQSCLKQPEENGSVLLSECITSSLAIDSNLLSGIRAQCLQSQPSLGLPSPSLQCYIHPYPVRFPSQTHRPGLLKQYYLLNAASLLPVLALQVKDGEHILDLCSAPGGKAIAIMQSCNPGKPTTGKDLSSDSFIHLIRIQSG